MRASGDHAGTEPLGRVEIVLLDADPNGLAEMLAGLLEANLARHPDRSALLLPAVVELDAVDADVTVSVRTLPGRIEIANGPAGEAADVELHASSQGLLALSAVPLRLGLPDPFRRSGRSVLGEIMRRRVRVSGMLRHPVVLSRFARLLSVA
ncbi:MAG: hypothetical protein ACRDHU_01065 [Actinomycetota bacterium]